MQTHINVIVIGGGQAGLAMSYHLTNAGIEHAVLEKEKQLAVSWRKRYDSLHTVTPNWMNSLPGLEFPGEADAFASKDQVIAYLTQYAEKLNPPLVMGCEVLGVEKKGNHFSVSTSGENYEASHIVIATGPFQRQVVPDFAKKLDKPFQIHSSEYKNPDQLPGGSVLVVGSGNSGVQLAIELAGERQVYLSRERDFTLPRRLPGKAFAMILEKLGITDRQVSEQEAERVEDLMWWMQHTGLYEMTIDSPLGNALSKGSDPYLGANLETVMAEHGIQGMAKVIDAGEEGFVFDDGASLIPDSVIWATGFTNDYPWLNIPVLDEHGQPIHEEGISPVSGVYFLGLRWMRHADSGLLKGVGRDAGHLLSAILESERQIA